VLFSFLCAPSYRSVSEVGFFSRQANKTDSQQAPQET
jgi:hypothetical protein